MKASNGFVVKTTGLRNPFASPVRPVDGEGVDLNRGQVGNQERLKRLEERIENLFVEIKALADNREVEELIGKFTELRQLMTDYGEEGTDVVRSKLERYKERLRQFGELQLSIQLQIYINEGNQLLRAMHLLGKRERRVEVRVARARQLVRVERAASHGRAADLARDRLVVRGGSTSDDRLCALLDGLTWLAETRRAHRRHVNDVREAGAARGCCPPRVGPLSYDHLRRRRLLSNNVTATDATQTHAADAQREEGPKAQTAWVK